jgi:hypothetical protein
MSKLPEKLFALVRQRQQRGGDQLPAKPEPKAVGLYGEDMTGLLHDALRYGQNNPAGAWDFYKARLHRSGGVNTVRLGDDRPVRVAIPEVVPQPEPRRELESATKVLKSFEQEYILRVLQDKAVADAT